MNRQQYLLMKLAEEAAEVAQIALKTMAFGMHETSPWHPDNNAKRCHAELNDVMGIISMLNEEFGFGYEVDEAAVQAKKDKVNHYYAYSVQLGETK
jgi:hypothetical protein